MEPSALVFVKPLCTIGNLRQGGIFQLMLSFVTAAVVFLLMSRTVWEKGGLK